MLSNVSYSVKSEDDSGKIILSDINLGIERGSRLAIMGRNGSGKTTLAKLIAGLILPGTGEVRVDGLLTRDNKFQANLGKMIGIVFQNPEHQMVTVTVERELALGLENYGYITEAIHHNVDSQLVKYHLEHLRKKMPNKISGGEKQKLALASVMILGPEILVLDEPMAHLDLAGREVFKAELDGVMKNEEVTIIYITQDLSEILGFDRVIILDEGKIVEDCSPSDLTKPNVILRKYAIEYPPALIFENVTQGEIIEALLKLPDPPEFEMQNAGRYVGLECRNLGFAWRDGKKIIEDLDLVLHKGKVHGLLGKIGCGKSTLALLMGGLLKPQQGTIFLNGTPVKQSDLVRAVAYVFQSPERGLFAGTLYEDIMYGPKNFGYTGDELDSLVKKAFSDVGLDMKLFKDRSPHTLSGGEARLAGIAGGLATGKEIIILDEPTEELDHTGRIQIIDLIRRLSSEEKTIMLISHDSDFLFEVCDYLSLWIGRKVKTYPKINLYYEAENFAQAATEVPHVIQVAEKTGMRAEFKKKGVYALRNLKLRQYGFKKLDRTGSVGDA